MRAILKEYGNHPSFVLYCNGNEITGNFDFVGELTASGRALDSRRLFSGSTARTRVKSDQYYVSQQTNKGDVKVYEGLPHTDWDRNTASDVDVPVISHESGQRCMFPDFGEIEKYAGSPVEPRNFMLFGEMLDRNGMLDQADAFFRASGALTVLEYKAVIETLLRSSRSAGFKLLSINNFPGQEYAPAGILDPFWEEERQQSILIPAENLAAGRNEVIEKQWPNDDGIIRVACLQRPETAGRKKGGRPAFEDDDRRKSPATEPIDAGP